MKKSTILTMFVAGGITLFTACESDRDSNPTLQEPDTFVLNAPAYAAEPIDLATTSSVPFSCSQPEFGYTAATTYKVQVSASGNFTVSVDNVQEGQTADYAELDDAFTTCNINANPAQMARAIQQVTLTPEEEVPAEMQISVRLAATVGSYTCYSNVVTCKVAPYYVELKDAAPEVWYLIGAVIADGKWTNSSQAIGTSMIPMFTKKDFDYDKKTGQGIIEYTGYFADGTFKIVRTPGDWDNIVCCKGSWDGETYNCFIRGKDGTDDPGDIDACVGAPGYYTITINTKEQTCSITKASVESPKVFTMMGMPGTYAGADWTPANNAMTPVETVAGAENHVWMKTVTFEEGNEFKFSDGDTWFGSGNFPYGPTNSDANILTKAGTYNVFFNDLMGSFFCHEVVAAE